MKKTLYEYCIEREDFSLLSQWDEEKNGELTSRDVSYGSNKKVWWQCKKGHEWTAAVFSRTSSGASCPYCAGRRISVGENDLSSQMPELAAQWHTEKNGDLKPEHVTLGSHKMVWWQCERGHVWQAQINSRSGGSGCPICKNRKFAEGYNDLASEFPDLAKQWHPTRNKTLSPKDVFSGSRQKVWWQCDKGHSWSAAIFARTRNETGCPVCSGKLVIAGENDLATIFPHIAAQWHDEKNLRSTPRTVSPYSNKKAWWICELGHEYNATISTRTTQGSGCPYCAGKKVLVGFNDLATVHPQIASQWHPELNGTVTPQQVTSGSRKRAWWQCAEGHVWKAAIYSRTGTKKHGCPVCAGTVKMKKQK